MDFPKLEAAEAYFGCPHLSGWTTLKYYDSDVEAEWIVCEEDGDGLQVIYKRKGLPGRDDENFWMYLSPDCAAMVGTLLLAWAKSRANRDGAEANA